jgi:ParB-like chromosome segregation protein Spo0J
VSPAPHPVPLKPLHSDSSLIPVKLEQLSRLTTEMILNSLKPGLRDSLKVRPDGTIIDGHHRIKILRSRGIEVNTLPREIVSSEELPEQ